MSNITVLGLGYIGLPTSIVLAKSGHKVFGYDINEKAISILKKGKIHITEKNLQAAYNEVIKTDTFIVENVIVKSEIYIIAVPTPFKKNENKKVADLSFVDSAAETIAGVLKEGDLVILESTVPPGSTKRMTDILEEKSGLSREKFHSVHCPERVLPGKILYELEHNDRIIGSERVESALLAKELYESFVKQGDIFITDDITAEMAKLVENTSRDVNIAFANELSIICDELDINVFELIKLANKHPRVDILNPGVGVGGHCLAVDPWFIVERYPKEAIIINNSRLSNDSKPFWVSAKVEKAISYDKSKTIGILGLAYKPNIDDLRESPSLVLAHDLVNKGYNVIGCEPNCNEGTVDGIVNLSLIDTLQEADFITLTLAHNEFIESKDIISKNPFFDCIGMMEYTNG